tara:strand:- start:169 stop:723 length:555 start_codon:yes stop_codon:yes gene_type:complete
MKATQITFEKSFLIQSHALVECLVRLGEMEVSQNVEFENLKDKIYGQTAKIIKKSHPEVPIFKGQGSLLTVFYLLLVLPHELIGQEKLVKAYDMTKAEEIAAAASLNVANSYKPTKPILTHFRNALSHGRIGWNNNRLTISDVMQRAKVTSKFYAEFTMEGLGEIAQELNMAFAMYVETALKKR